MYAEQFCVLLLFTYTVIRIKQRCYAITFVYMTVQKCVEQITDLIKKLLWNCAWVSGKMKYVLRGLVIINYSVSPVEWELRYDWLDSWCWSFWLNSGLQHGPLPSLSPHHLVSLHAHYRCPSLLVSQKSIAIASLQTWKPPIFCTFFPRQDLPRSCLYPKGSIKEIHQTCIKKWSTHLIWIFTVTAAEEGVGDGKYQCRLTGEDSKMGNGKMHFTRKLCD